MKKIILIIFFIISFSTTIFANEYTISNGIKISIPQNWQSLDLYGNLIIWAGASPISPNDTFRENVNLAEEKWINDSIEDYVAENKRAMSIFLKNFKIINENYFKIKDKNEFKKIHSMKFIYNDEISKRKLKIISFFFLYQGKGYVLTCSATEETYISFEPIFRNIIGSIKFSN
tara:strand:+ start:736 stop:1257 length:522 start_codon:yes stop_codon:yes gene_type:complete